MRANPCFSPQGTISLFAFEKLLVSEELAKELELSTAQQRKIQAWVKSIETESSRLMLELFAGQIGDDDVVRLGDEIKRRNEQQLAVKRFQNAFWEENRSQITQIQTSLNKSILEPLDARQRELLDERAIFWLPANLEKSG